MVMAEDCSAGDWLGIDALSGTIRRMREGDKRICTADRAYRKGEQIIWPHYTDTSQGATIVTDKREQVALQCEAVAHLAGVLAGVRQEYARLFRSGAMDDLLDMIGRETARQMELLGDVLNGMDAVSKSDERQFAPVFTEAHRLWPDA